MEHHPFNPTPEQRANLERLAAHLDLGVTNLNFDMGDFSDVGQDPHTCGSVGCAVGHGPSLGIMPAESDENWDDYSSRVFGAGNFSNQRAFDWLFSGHWAETDNTPRGAAARIRYTLSSGVPSNAPRQIVGEEPLSYTVPDRVESPATVKAREVAT